MIRFDKLILVKDSEYGTHVTYITEYPVHIFLNYYTEKESLEDIIKSLEYYIELEKIRKKIK